jgi:hypothetical protein
MESKTGNTPAAAVPRTPRGAGIPRMAMHRWEKRRATTEGTGGIRARPGGDLALTACPRWSMMGRHGKGMGHPARPAWSAYGGARRAPRRPPTIFEAASWPPPLGRTA